MIRAEAYAKVNLRHRVLGAETSGFHSVETLLARTSLSDTLTVEFGGEGISLAVDGPLAEGVPEGPENLCWRAAEVFLQRAFGRRGRRKGVKLSLTKRIPMGAGLGGGSADAAATLRLLADRWGRLTEAQLISVAGELGSDVPFGVLGVPLALGWERGRRLLPLRAPQPRPALLVCPSFEISTPAAYAWLAKSRVGRGEAGGASVMPGASRIATWESLARLVRNDLEAPVIQQHPELGEILDQLRTFEPTAVAMTGSGSTCYAVFGDEMARADARTSMETQPGSRSDWRLVDVHLPV